MGGMCPSRLPSVFVLVLLCAGTERARAGNPDAKRLYDDLLSNYNKLVRPVRNTTDVLTVYIKLKLSQLIDVVSRVAGSGQVPWPRTTRGTPT